jgi:predicted RNase H-like HicB family nuclease
MLKYSVSIKWNDEDDGYIATVPELPGLSAFGKTQKKALDELKIATEAYIETLKEVGRTLPIPEKITLYSGQLRLRLPKGLHAKLSAAAENQGISLNTYLVSLLSEEHSKQEIIKTLKELILEERQKLLSVHNILNTGSNRIYPSIESVTFATGESTYGRMN